MMFSRQSIKFKRVPLEPPSSPNNGVFKGCKSKTARLWQTPWSLARTALWLDRGSAIVIPQCSYNCGRVLIKIIPSFLGAFCLSRWKSKRARRDGESRDALGRSVTTWILWSPCCPRSSSGASLSGVLSNLCLPRRSSRYGCYGSRRLGRGCISARRMPGRCSSSSFTSQSIPRSNSENPTTSRSTATPRTSRCCSPPESASGCFTSEWPSQSGTMNRGITGTAISTGMLISKF